MLADREYDRRGGFTLIELSVVLVIMGLIVGGVLVGQSLIDAAAVRAQITQIEKFNQAVNTFYGKYGYLPGDLPAGPAAQFGFAPRGPNPGQGDGNGLIQGWNGTLGAYQQGETMLFWEDLSTANLIQGNFQTAGYGSNGVISTTSSPSLAQFLPAAKLGASNYLFVWIFNSENYFAISSYATGASFIATDGGNFSSTSALTVKQAYAIDTKMDDGLPQTGNVQAILAGTVEWAGSFASWYGGTGIGGTNTTPWPPSSTSCFDNGAVAGTQYYSVEFQDGANLNCALVFRFQ